MATGFGNNENLFNKLSIQNLVDIAIRLQLEGDLKKASIYYEEYIKRDLNNPNVFFNYGILLYQLNKFQEAETNTKKAIKLKPDFAEAYNNLGNIQREQNKYFYAEKSFRKAIQLNPLNGMLQYNLGNVLKQLGKFGEAKDCFLKSIELNPNFAEAHNNLGNVLKQLGKFGEAKGCFLKSIKLNPNFAEAYNNLGVLFKDENNSAEAEFNFKKAIAIRPDYDLAHNNLGTVFLDSLMFKEAELSFNKAIKINPKLPLSHCNLGTSLIRQGKIKNATKAFEKAIELKPDFAEAYNNLGNFYKDIGSIDNAKKFFEKAIELKPDFAMAYLNYGLLKVSICQYYEAIKMFEKALDYKKDLSQAKSELIHTKGLICDWSKQGLIKKWLIDLGIKGSSINPLSLLYIEDDPLKQLERAKNFHKENFYRTSTKLSKYKNHKIHIGYFSADFRNHPTMFLINSLLKLHDKSKFKIFLYSFATKEDSFTVKAKNTGCFFKDIKELNEEEIVKLARKDRIDIAIDLMGYIENNRCSIFSLRLAPIQINYLGYPGSLGSKCFDYILGDENIITKEDQIFYSEKIIRVPNCYQCNSHSEIKLHKKITRKDFNLPKDGFLFACFNSSKKITSSEFDIWMRLLKKVDKSIIWLYKSNEFVLENLKKEAEKRDINPDRLFFAERLPLEEHLARYKICDLFLDTFNYNGHTTTSDALWAGLPVLTKKGDSFSSRVSTSILRCLGLNELITHSKKSYEEKALYLTQNNKELSKIRIKLEQSIKNGPFFNSSLFTTNLEKIFIDLVN